MRATAVLSIRITHRSSGEVIAEGPVGFRGITPFEGKSLHQSQVLEDALPATELGAGLCIYKFLYVWLDLRLPNGTREPFVGWMYWLPNPLLPFIAFHTEAYGATAFTWRPYRKTEAIARRSPVL